MLQWVARKLLNEMGDPDEKYAVGDVVQFPTPDGMGSYAGAVQSRSRRRRRGAVRLQPSAGRPARDLRSAADRRAVSGTMPQEILLAEPRGFCAGVDRAIEIVERALAKFGAPIYVRHEIVHNTYVVNDLKAKGAIFIEDLADVPPGATLVFTAHGVSKAVQARGARARLRDLRRHLPAGDQGARRSGQARQGRLRVHHDRPQGPSRGRRHDGPARRAASTWWRTWPTWRTVQPAQTEQAGRGHADHAVGGRRGRDHRRRARALSRACASPSSRTSATPRRTGRTR